MEDTNTRCDGDLGSWTTHKSSGLQNRPENAYLPFLKDRTTVQPNNPIYRGLTRTIHATETACQTPLAYCRLRNK